MRFDPRKVRQWFLYAAAAVVLVVLIAYVYGRFRTVGAKPPQALQPEIERSTQGFSLSKAEAGHTLFTIHAGKTIEYKEGGRADLHDVNVIVYGKEGNRYDQVRGAEFEYNQDTGDVIGHGEVEIDLESNPQGAGQPTAAPPHEQKNLIHVRTTDLKFNEKTGIATTPNEVDFRLPQATGTSIGAVYESNSGKLVLNSAVVIDTEGAHPAHITADTGTLTRKPHQAVLEHAVVTEPQRGFAGDHLVIFLRPDNSAEHMIATGNVQASGDTNSGSHYVSHAPEAEFIMGPKNTLRTSYWRNGVTIDGTGTQPMTGSAQTAQVDFGENNRVSKIHAEENVHLKQLQGEKKKGQTFEMYSDGLDIFTNAKGIADHAVTSGKARIEIVPEPTPGKSSAGNTVITAGVFHTKFDERGRLHTMHGEPDAKIVSPNPAPNQPPRVSTSRALDAMFNSGNGGAEWVTQTGDVHYDDGQRQAFAQKGRYTPDNQLLVLTGAPRVMDTTGVTTAVVIEMNRATGEADADKDVKTTYNSTKPQPTGAMLSSSSPVHVTADHMHVVQSAGTAHYTGNARLWQNANIVEAPVIDFDHGQSSMTAQGSAVRPVLAVFVNNNNQQPGQTQQAPVNVTSQRLTYVDGLRKARFDGDVVMKSDQGTLWSDHLDVFLKPRNQQPPQTAQNQQNGNAGQIDRAVAEGHVILRQPARKGTGDKLVYTSDDEKYVLTGDPEHQPEVDDVQRGVTRGDILTMYQGDDRVLVESASNVPTFTQARVK